MAFAHVYQHRRGARSDFWEIRKAPKVPGFSPFRGKSLGGWRFNRADFTIFGMFPISGDFCALAAENGTYFWQLLEGVCPSITTSMGRPVGFLGNAESAESAGICTILGGKSLGGFGTLLMPILQVFTMFPLRGEAFGGLNFRVFAAESGTYLWQHLEGACPCIPTSVGRPGRFPGNAESAGICAIFGKSVWGGGGGPSTGGVSVFG